MDLSTFAPLVGATWVLTEFVGRAFVLDKDRVALILGPLFGAVGHYVGWINVHSTGPRGWVEALAGGLLATVVAAASHDKLVKPVTKSLKRGN